MLKIAIDKRLSLIESVAKRDCKIFDFHKIDNLSGIDAVIVKSNTKFIHSLDKANKLKFVATASVGFEKLPIDMLKKHKIYWCSSSGSNANSVVEYVIAVLSKFNTYNKTIGILGAGNIGFKLYNILKALKINVIYCDPCKKDSVSFDELISCSDFLTIHTPLNFQKNKTYKLFDKRAFELMKCDVTLINTARGEIIVENDLINFLDKNPKAKAILDVFCNEPFINKELAKKCCLATAHIAGHSAFGKYNMQKMIWDKFCDFFNLTNRYPLFSNKKLIINKRLDIQNIIASIIDIDSYHNDLLKDFDFKRSRNEHPYRYEFKQVKLNFFNGNAKILGFKL